jgi:hypothetical protein
LVDGLEWAEDGHRISREEKIHTRFASERCSARTPGRDVKSAPGRSVDVRDSMEDRVSMMMGPSVSTLVGDSHRAKVYAPVIVYASAVPPARGSSFCARSTLRAMSLRISKWRTRNSCPSKALFVPSASAAFSNEARHRLTASWARSLKMVG